MYFTVFSRNAEKETHIYMNFKRASTRAMSNDFPIGILFGRAKG